MPFSMGMSMALGAGANLGHAATVDVQRHTRDVQCFLNRVSHDLFLEVVVTVTYHSKLMILFQSTA